ncbi:MAG: hypothetical protein WCI18_13985 [Pseudomonadota bacterium]
MIIVSSLLGLLAAVCLVMLLITSTPKFFFQKSVLSWFLFLLSLSSLAVFHRAFIYGTLGVMVLSLITQGITYRRALRTHPGLPRDRQDHDLFGVLRILPGDKLGEKRDASLGRKATLASLFLLFVTSAVASLPKRRYDQWNYHLSLPKWIMDLGGLPKDIFNDHLYFTGSYEYFSGIFRVFGSEDLWVQSATSAMTCLTVASLCALTLTYFLGSRYKLETSRDRGLLFLGFFLLAAFSPWDRECLYSAKPDYLLIPLTLGVVALVSRLMGSSEENPPVERREGPHGDSVLSFSLGILLSGGIAVKITWIHLSMAVVLGSLFYGALARPKHRFVWRQLILGLGVGAVFALPILLKNYIYFGDPLYPAKTPGFVSFFRTEYVNAYWMRNSSPPRSLSDLTQFFVSLPLTFLSNYGYLLLALVFSSTNSLKSIKNSIKGSLDQGFFKALKAIRFLSRPSLSILLFYILLWPLLHRLDIFPRFIIPIVGILIWEIAFFNVSLKKLYLAVGVLVCVQGDPNIMLRLLFQGKASPSEFYSKTSEGEVFQVVKDLNRELHSPGKDAPSPEGEVSPQMTRSDILINSTVSYFFFDHMWDVCSYSTRAQLEKKGIFWTSEQAAAPYTDEMISSMISALHIKYYAHLKNDYCKKPEVLEYMRKHATLVGPEGNLFKIRDAL